MPRLAAVAAKYTNSVTVQSSEQLLQDEVTPLLCMPDTNGRHAAPYDK